MVDFITFFKPFHKRAMKKFNSYIITTMNKKMLFKTIAVILIQAFLLLDIAWAGGTEILPSKQVDCLSPAVQIDTQLLTENFQKLYEVKLGKPILKDVNLPDEISTPTTTNIASFRIKIADLIRTVLAVLRPKRNRIVAILFLAILYLFVPGQSMFFDHNFSNQVVAAETAAAPQEQELKRLIEALGGKYSSDSYEACTKLGKMNNERAKFYSYLYLGNIDEALKIKGASELAIEALNHKSVKVRIGAATVLLNEKEDKRAIQSLISDLEYEQVYSGIGPAAKILVKAGGSAVEPLIYVLKDKNEHIRRQAAGALGEIGDERAIRPLIKLYHSAANGSFEEGDVERALDKIASKSVYNKINVFIYKHPFWAVIFGLYGIAIIGAIFEMFIIDLIKRTIVFDYIKLKVETKRLKKNSPLVIPLLNALKRKRMPIKLMVREAIPAAKNSIKIYFSLKNPEKVFGLTVDFGIRLVNRDVGSCSAIQYGIPMICELSRGNIDMFERYLTHLEELAVELGEEGINVYKTLSVITDYKLANAPFDRLSLVKTPEDFKILLRAAQFVVRWKIIARDKGWEFEDDSLKRIINFCDTAEEFQEILELEDKSFGNNTYVVDVHITSATRTFNAGGYSSIENEDPPPGPDLAPGERILSRNSEISHYICPGSTGGGLYPVYIDIYTIETSGKDVKVTKVALSAPESVIKQREAKKDNPVSSITDNTQVIQPILETVIPEAKVIESTSVDNLALIDQAI